MAPHKSPIGQPRPLHATTWHRPDRVIGPSARMFESIVQIKPIALEPRPGARSNQQPLPHGYPPHTKIESLMPIIHFFILIKTDVRSNIESETEKRYRYVEIFSDEKYPIIARILPTKKHISLITNQQVIEKNTLFDFLNDSMQKKLKKNLWNDLLSSTTLLIFRTLHSEYEASYNIKKKETEIQYRLQKTNFHLQWTCKYSPRGAQIIFRCVSLLRSRYSNCILLR